MGTASEALAHLDHALKALEGLPAGDARNQREFALRAIQGPALGMVTGGPGSPSFGAAHARAMELVRSGARSDHDTISVIYNCALHEWARARHAEAQAMIRLLDQAAGASGEDGPWLAASTMRGLVSWHMGQTEAAAASLTAAVRLCDAGRHRSLHALSIMEFDVFGRFYLGLAETVLGRADAGARHADAALELADQVRRPHAHGFALLAKCTTAWLRDDAEAAARWSASSLDFASTQGFPEFVALSRFVSGWSACRQGRLEEGLSLMEAGAAAWDATGFLSWQPLMAAHRAWFLVAAGELAAAEVLLDLFGARIAATGEAQAAAPLRLARAQLWMARGSTAAGRAEARAALAIAEAQKARAWLGQIEASGLLG